MHAFISLFVFHKKGEKKTQNAINIIKIYAIVKTNLTETDNIYNLVTVTSRYIIV